MNAHELFASGPGQAPRDHHQCQPAQGTLALATGAFFGVLAFTRWSDRNHQCAGDVCTSPGVAAGDSAASAALIADVALGVGVAALAAGGILLYHSRRGPVTAAPGKGDAWMVRLLPTTASTRGVAVGVNW